MALLSIAAVFTMSSCEKDKTYTYTWPDDDTGGGGTEPAGEKPRFIWVDAAANFPDFANSKENIARDLALAKDAGFTDIVVDVRPTTGDVLFKTDKVQQVAWLGAWLPGGYSKVERTATWDYLQAFIDEGHKLGLKIHAGFNTMVGGNASTLGDQGVLFRDKDTKKAWATSLNLTGGITNTMDVAGETTKFLNPSNPDVQTYLASLVTDLAVYPDLDGIILDRGRFNNLQSDFSSISIKAFEAYVGETGIKTVDILPAGATVAPATYPKYMKQWLEFRVKTIHDLMTKLRQAAKASNAKIKFGVYVGGWYSTYYDVGVNWGSKKYNTGGTYKWASDKYKNFGYADLMDQMLIGAYANPGAVNGEGEWTMEGFCKKAMVYTQNDCPMVAGGPDVGNWDANDKFTQDQENAAITSSVVPCINACDGYFLFDMIHLKKANQWKYAKAGIEAYMSTIKK